MAPQPTRDVAETERARLQPQLSEVQHQLWKALTDRAALDRYDVYTQLWLYRLYLGISDGMFARAWACWYSK